jgi:eukaryotic-like serine/threonine-protein kinase
MILMILFQGQKIGKYEILDALGSGGFASVYKAMDTWLKKIVAIKIPHQQGGDINKLLMEPQLLAKLDHENIVKLISAEMLDNVFIVVMEFVDGPSLEDIIAEKGKLEVSVSIPIIRQIASAVDYAHLNNIIHRDLRPANILIEKNSKIRVADFGISKLLENTHIAKTIIGTPPYMAPEHFEGRTVFASDLYSIGVIFYEMLTGTLPYYDPNPGILKKKLLEESFTPPRVLNVAVPQRINDIILKCLEKEISKRYQRGGDLLVDLDSCVIGSNLQKEIAEIRKRISLKEEPERKLCWSCQKPLPPRALSCPRCGEVQ